MSDPNKTFKVHCDGCKKPFHVRFPLNSSNSDEEGSGDVMVDCMYCSEKLMITIPRKYIEKDILLKSRLVK